MPTALYVHIPFCLKRCIYCDFVSGIYEPEKAGAYIEALKKEVQGRMIKGISTLYIGGGTPTALATDVLADLIKYIFSLFQFAENYEATIEANPGTIDKEKLQAIRSSGINRISIGVQSFNDDELAFLGRIHSSGDAEQAVHLARSAGFENIGIDLIYGIPGPSIESWKRTLEEAVRLKPQHISTYELTVEEGTELSEYLMDHPHPNPLPSRERVLKKSPPSPRGRGIGGGGNNLSMPEEDTIIEMYEYTIDYLTANGYVHYEISNFALPGYQCRHNLNYWDRGEYYGVGLGAHSFIDGKRFYNTDNLDEYLKMISEGKSPIKETEDITADKAFFEAFFLGLRKTEGINLKAFSERYGKDILQLYGEKIGELQDAGLMELGTNRLNRYLRLTRKGILLSNEIFAGFT
ncbi:MAG: radical SAM family heme chaperone HemW [Nitrospirae bacterium]|nr:radical SAM family heme chaperone HemW [Nitrospirota bacterium]